MTIRVGINGFGRIGRLVLRAAWDWPELRFVHVNDPGGDLQVQGRPVRFTQAATIADGDWSGCDVVIEASGRMRKMALLEQYLAQGVARVVVSAPVKEPGALNVVMGVNDHLFDPTRHRIVTAASCTTNCLAPVVKVVHETFGIRHGSMTTIHDLTNTQSILTGPTRICAGRGRPA